MMLNNRALTRQVYSHFAIVKYCLLLVFLKSLNAWFTWGLSLGLVNIIGILGICFFLLLNPKSLSIKKIDLIVILLFAVAKIYTLNGLEINAYFTGFLTIFIISFTVLLKDELKIELFIFLSKSLTLIIIISLLFWIIHSIGVNFPFNTINFNNGQYWFNNHYFFLDNLGEHVTFSRFSSIFLEPGHIGVIMAFLFFIYIFYNRGKNFKILLVGILATLSLATYILSAFSLIYFLFKKSKNRFLHLLLALSLALIVFQYFSDYNKGDNIINNAIIERLQFKDGNFKGNNRFSNQMDNAFDYFIQSNKNLFGVGQNEYARMNLGANAGYKVYLMIHGIIGTILILLFYFSLAVKDKNKLTWFLLVLYILCFLQAAYPLWECELLIFITAGPLLRELSHNLKKEEVGIKEDALPLLPN